MCDATRNNLFGLVLTAMNKVSGYIVYIVDNIIIFLTHACSLKIQSIRIEGIYALPISIYAKGNYTLPFFKYAQVNYDLPFCI